MKSSIFLLSALTLITHAFPGNFARVNAEDHLECLNDEAFDATDDHRIRRDMDTAPLPRAVVVQIDAYAHVLVSEKIAKPAVAKETVQNKFDFLNKNFKPWGYHFSLLDTDITAKAEWTQTLDAAKGAQPSLRRGDYRTLNVYIVEGAGAGVCSFPVREGSELTQERLTDDGCFVPWGPATNASTLTHEVGHWMNGHRLLR